MSNDLMNKRDEWSKWENYVLTTLDELKETTKGTDTKINEIRIEMLTGMGKIISKIAVLETKMTMKAAISGGLTALIPITITLTIWLITRSNV